MKHPSRVVQAPLAILSIETHSSRRLCGRGITDAYKFLAILLFAIFVCVRAALHHQMLHTFRGLDGTYVPLQVHHGFTLMCVQILSPKPMVPWASHVFSHAVEKRRLIHPHPVLSRDDKLSRKTRHKWIKTAVWIQAELISPHLQLLS